MLVATVAGYGLLPSQSFYFLLLAFRRKYKSFTLPLEILLAVYSAVKPGAERSLSVLNSTLITFPDDTISSSQPVWPPHRDLRGFDQLLMPSRTIT